MISTLMNVLKNSQDELLRLEAADSLIQIDPSSPEIETALIKLAKASQSEWIRRDAAHSLRQLNPEHPDAISVLINLFHTSQDESFRWTLRISEIGIGHPEVLKILLKLMCIRQDATLRMQAGYYLGKIAAHHSPTIQTLLSFLRFRKAALNLLGISQDNYKEGINYLENLLVLSDVLLMNQDKKLRRQAIWQILKMGADQPEIAADFLELFWKSQGDEACCKNTLKLLTRVGIEQSEVISTCIHLLNLAKSDWVRLSISYILGKLDPGNSKAKEALEDFLGTCESENTKRIVAFNLKELDPKSEKAIEAFSDLLKNGNNWTLSHWSAESLGEMSNENPQVLELLLDLLSSNQERRIFSALTYGFQRVFEHEALSKIVTKLKNHLTKEIRENNYLLYRCSFEISWHCAAKLPYSEFYKQWCE